MLYCFLSASYEHEWNLNLTLEYLIFLSSFYTKVNPAQGSRATHYSLLMNVRGCRQR